MKMMSILLWHALPLVIFSVVKRVTGLVTGILGMLGGRKLLSMLKRLKPTSAGAAAGATTVASSGRVSRGFQMGAMNPATVRKIEILRKFGKTRTCWYGSY